MKNGLFIFLLLASLQAKAQFLEEGTITAVTVSGDYYSGGVLSRGAIYVVPNEISPERSRPVVELAPEGVYMTVGAERGLIGAAISPNVTHLLQIDLVPEVVLFNQLNVILLKLARRGDLNDYLSLRQATHEEWLTRANRADLNARERSLLRSRSSHEFYTRVEVESRDRLINPEFFVGVSHLRMPEVFTRIQEMALAGRIQVLQVNLTDITRLQAVARQLQALGLSISVLDMSNAWEEKYIGPTGVSDLLNALDSALQANSVIMATNVATCIRAHLCHWDYRGYTYELLQEVRSRLGRANAITQYIAGVRSLSPNQFFGLNSGQAQIHITELSLPPILSDALRICSRLFR